MGVIERILAAPGTNWAHALSEVSKFRAVRTMKRMPIREKMKAKEKVRVRASRTLISLNRL